MKTHLKLRAAFLFCFTLCFAQFSQLSASEHAVNVEIISTTYIGKTINTTPITFLVSNLGNESISALDLVAEIKMRSGKSENIFAEAKFAGDPNNNNLLDPNEFWIYSSTVDLPFVKGDSYIVTAGVSGNTPDEQVVAADGALISCAKINMDVNIVQECVEPGDKIDIELISRLLIDEDAAKNPGTTTIIVGGVPITIDLPVTFYEARDIMISATGLNGGADFDPFDPPAGVELTNFCEQAGQDNGRNQNNVLDECETIETLRAPCAAPGEDDILCEFPDWQFCYCVTIPEDYDQDMFEIVASDAFTVWQAEDTPDDWTDITDDIEAAGTDSDEVEVKLPIILPVDLLSFTVKKERQTVVLDWTTQSETNNSHFNVEKSTNGIDYLVIGRIEGLNNSQQRKDYSFVDEKPRIGKNYYRLAQYDFDGTMKKTETVVVDFETPVRAAEFTVAPNPIIDKFTLQGADLDDQMRITIFDLSGRKVLETSVNPNQEINTSELSGGTYIVNVFDYNNLKIGAKQIVVMDK